MSGGDLEQSEDTVAPFARKGRQTPVGKDPLKLFSSKTKKRVCEFQQQYQQGGHWGGLVIYKHTYAGKETLASSTFGF